MHCRQRNLSGSGARPLDRRGRAEWRRGVALRQLGCRFCARGGQPAGVRRALSLQEAPRCRGLLRSVLAAQHAFGPACPCHLPSLPPCSVGEAIGAANVPGHTDYLAFFATFKDVWVKADGAWSVKSTPRGLRYATWSKVRGGGSDMKGGCCVPGRAGGTRPPPGTSSHAHPLSAPAPPAFHRSGAICATAATLP